MAFVSQSVRTRSTQFRAERRPFSFGEYQFSRRESCSLDPRYAYKRKRQRKPVEKKL